jgi:ribosome-associated heat shock protein Hsp15
MPSRTVRGVDGVRLDKWLWAARFYKTRAAATEAVTGGRVHVNDQATKPAKAVRVGDRLEITTGRSRFVVDVLETSERRGPPAEAARLYAETPKSREAREQASAERRMAPPPQPVSGGRPTKRDRRRLDRDRRR